MSLQHRSTLDDRGFDPVELDLEPAGLTLIAGRDDAGKSALLSAIDRPLDTTPSRVRALVPADVNAPCGRGDGRA